MTSTFTYAYTRTHTATHLAGAPNSPPAPNAGFDIDALVTYLGNSAPVGPCPQNRTTKIA